MNEVYVVAWSGGYEAPSYTAMPTEEAAWRVAREWIGDIKEGDTIDVLKIDLTTMVVTRLEAA